MGKKFKFKKTKTTSPPKSVEIVEEMEANLSKVLNPRPVLSGMLLKYTNYVKGYQMRFFTVDAQKGLLTYYLCEGPEDNPVPNITPQPRWVQLSTLMALSIQSTFFSGAK